jgi:hypothetical protein
MDYKAVDMEKTSEDKCKMVVRLYKAQKHTIKEIMEIASVPSEQTVYAILDEYKVPRLRKRNIARSVSISIDTELDEIIAKVKPKNLSKWLCEMAKKGAKLK